MKISQSALREVENALEEFRIALDNSDLSDSSKRSYYRRANRFIRWIEGDYEPGQGLR